MENYYAIMVYINNKEEKVEYTCDKLTLNTLESYMCDLFRTYPEAVKNTFKDSDNLFYFYENPDEEDIVQFIFSEEIDENSRYEHYFVYAENNNEALHTLKDFFIKKYILYVGSVYE